MEALSIAATDSTPKVFCDSVNGIFEMSGDSRPENAREFYAPILKWLDDYVAELKQDKPGAALTLNLDFEYLNSISIKYIYEVLKRAEELGREGLKVEVNWHYNVRDEDIKENGEEFVKMLNIPVKLIEKK